jgi:hypothetical protein
MAEGHFHHTLGRVPRPNEYVGRQHRPSTNPGQQKTGEQPTVLPDANPWDPHPNQFVYTPETEADGDPRRSGPYRSTYRHAHVLP